MDRAQSTQAKFESSNLGLILGPADAPGVDFLDHDFLSSKNSG